ncbi:unnamed protein product [Clonostachys solani]|uniref:Uncharacterized protein n=1 Tax=Clonostachys solani TaxID=160281 RepID=A0A9N9Z5A2_9HYPO|nr:unnamed protein product [Clonostachys solani]
MPNATENSIEACQELVERGIPSEFPDAGQTCVDGTPSKLVEYGSVSLWGQYQVPGRRKWINLRGETLWSVLRRLASGGIGGHEEYEGVVYKFMAYKVSGSTTPISNLR